MTRRDFLPTMCAAGAMPPEGAPARLAAEIRRRRKLLSAPFDWKTVRPLRQELTAGHARLLGDAALWRLRAEAAPPELWRPPARQPYKPEKPRPDGNGGGAGYTLLDLSAAWLATGDEFYAEQALRAMRNVCEFAHWGGNGKPRDTDLAAGALLFGLGAAYDTFHAKLAAADRKPVFDKLVLQARLMYRHHRARATVPWEQNHTYIDLGGLWCTAVALTGETPEAAEWYELGSRAIKSAVYLLDGGDGAFYEGIGYWSYGFARHLLPLLEVYRHATGEDPFAAFASLRNLKYYLAHTLLPGGQYALNLGDVDGAATARPRAGVRQAMLKMAGEYDDPECQFLAGLSGKGPASDPWTLVFWDPGVPARDPRPAWSPCHYFRDLDLVIGRTAWRDDATHFALRCGPALGHRATRILLAKEIPNWKPGSGHVHPDLNGLLLFDHGEHFLVDTGYTWAKVTREHNTVAVDGAGQTGDGQRWPNYDPWDRYGRIGAYLDLPGEYCFLRGEAAGGYREALKLNRFDRHLAMMADPEATYFLIHDVLESAVPHRYDWLLILIDQAVEVGPGVYRVRSGKRALTIHLLEPAGLAAAQEPVKVMARENQESDPRRGHRLAFSVAGRANAEFVALLALHAAEEPGPEIKASGGLIHAASAHWSDVHAMRGAAGTVATDGRYATIRRERDRVARWAVHDATRLAFEGRDLCTASAPVSAAGVGGAVALELKQAAEIGIAAPRPSTCQLDGAPAAFRYQDGMVRLRVPAGSHRVSLASIRLEDWWTEGGEKVWLEGGHLHQKADAEGAYVGTVWRRAAHPADFELELDAHVVSSSTDVNNINLFFNYTDPAGTPLEETREARRSGEYGLYHKLSGYIVTFLNDPEGKGKARVRIRRNPGFKLLAETFAYHCRRGVTYRLKLTKRGGEIRFAVDGNVLLRATDPEPLGAGHFALRTFRTWLWWDNIVLKNRSA